MLKNKRSVFTNAIGRNLQLETQMSTRQQVEADIKDQVKQNIEQSRHQDQIVQLDSIRNNVQVLSNYKTNVESKFHRKSLELQFRQYFVAVDSFQEQKKQNNNKSSISCYC